MKVRKTNVGSRPSRKQAPLSITNCVVLALIAVAVGTATAKFASAQSPSASAPAAPPVYTAHGLLDGIYRPRTVILSRECSGSRAGLTPPLLFIENNEVTMTVTDTRYGEALIKGRVELVVDAVRRELRGRIRARPVDPRLSEILYDGEITEFPVRNDGRPPGYAISIKHGGDIYGCVVTQEWRGRLLSSEVWPQYQDQIPQSLRNWRPPSKPGNG